MMYGLDQLGAAKYADLVVREHPENFAFGCFYDTFGNALSVIERVAQTGRCPLIRVQLMWDDNHNFTVDDIQTAARKAQNIQKLAVKYPSVKFQVSPFCEHRLRLPFLNNLAAKIKVAAPACEYVNSPIPGGDIMPEEVNEFHGVEKKPRRCKKYQFSFDGTSAEDSDVEAYKANYKDAKAFFLWSPRFNGRWEDNDKTPRPQRKGWPDSNFIDSIIYLSHPRGSCKLAANHLLKSHSENKGNGDPRAEKPVYICPVKARSIELVASNGQVVASLRYFGTYTDGRFRYYASEMGYQIAEKCKRIQGDPLTQVRINGKIFGIVNCGFRFGSFRN